MQTGSTPISSRKADKENFSKEQMEQQLKTQKLANQQRRLSELGGTPLSRVISEHGAQRESTFSPRRCPAPATRPSRRRRRSSAAAPIVACSPPGTDRRSSPHSWPNSRRTASHEGLAPSPPLRRQAASTSKSADLQATRRATCASRD